MSSPKAVDAGPDAESPPEAGAAAAADAGPEAATQEAEEDCYEYRPADSLWNTPACKAIKKRNFRVLHAVPPIVDDGAGGFDADAESGACFPAKDGSAWGILFTHPVVRGDVKHHLHTLHAKWQVAHVDKKGHVVASPILSPFVATSMGGTGFGALNNLPAVFDYDHDGSPELVLPVGMSEHNGSGIFTGSVWTFKNGKVERYAPAPNPVVGVQDIDCDGRPDLMMDAPFVATLDCGGRETSSNGPWLVAHSLEDGTFSLDDNVARNFASDDEFPAECGKPPNDIGKPPDLAKVRCARLWGVPSATLVAQIRARCRLPSPGDLCASLRPGQCYEKKTLLRWARAKPPLTLKRKPKSSDGGAPSPSP